MGMKRINRDKLKIFLKYFSGTFILFSLVTMAFKLLIQGKSFEEINYMYNSLVASLFSIIIGLSKARQ